MWMLDTTEFFRSCHCERGIPVLMCRSVKMHGFQPECRKHFCRSYVEAMSKLSRRKGIGGLDCEGITGVLTAYYGRITMKTCKLHFTAL